MHFAEYSHPFNLLDPDADDSDEEEEEKKRKVKSPVVAEEDDGDKTEEYDSDDVCDPISANVFELKELYRMMCMM